MSIKKNLKKLEQAGCDIAITACTTGNAKAELQVKNYPENDLLGKTITDIKSEERIVNNIDAIKIIDKI